MDDQAATDAKIEALPDAYRYTWCEGPCGCNGCVNRYGGVESKAMWLDWVDRNPGTEYQMKHFVDRHRAANETNKAAATMTASDNEILEKALAENDAHHAQPQYVEFARRVALSYASAEADKERTVNVNDYVNVRLNDTGVKILRDRHDALYKYDKHPKKFTLPEVDKDGFTRYQLHELMRIFGPHITHSFSLGFDPEIHIA